MAKAGRAALSPDVTIRQLLDSDLDEYRRIRLATLATEPDYFGSTFTEESVRPLSHFADRLSSSVIFGACAADRVIGVIHFRREPRATEAHKGSVQGFFVEPDWRGRGVGAALLSALLDTARTQVEQVTLTVVHGNAAAIALYERFGFTVYGIEPRARKTSRGYADQVLMIRLF
jgi:ribosomal protein S18 acetylase RimI-like enzyme